MNLERVTVVGSGAGGMAVAAEAAGRGSVVCLADLEEYDSNLTAISSQGGILVEHQEPHTSEIVPIAQCTTNLPEAVAASAITIVVAPLMGHERLLAAIGADLSTVECLLFAGEGGGALRVRASGRAPSTVVAELNTLPYVARLQGPGQVMIRNKRGGVFLAAVPNGRTAEVVELARGLWPWVGPAHDVLDTLLTNYNAIDHVPTVLTNAGYLEAGDSPWALWGDGCTPAVARAIEALDQELQHLRQTLGLPERRYVDCLIAQGMADEGGATLYDTVQRSLLSKTTVQRSPQFLRSRFVMEDVPHALVLIESIAATRQVPVPLISSLITLASCLVGEDLRASGTTLASLGASSATDQQGLLEEMTRA